MQPACEQGLSRDTVDDRCEASLVTTLEELTKLIVTFPTFLLDLKVT